MLQKQEQTGAYQRPIETIQAGVDILFRESQQTSSHCTRDYSCGCRCPGSHSANKESYHKNKSCQGVTAEKYLPNTSQNHPQGLGERAIHSGCPVHDVETLRKLCMKDAVARFCRAAVKENQARCCCDRTSSSSPCFTMKSITWSTPSPVCRLVKT